VIVIFESEFLRDSYNLTVDYIYKYINDKADEYFRNAMFNELEKTIDKHFYEKEYLGIFKEEENNMMELAPTLNNSYLLQRGWSGANYACGSWLPNRSFSSYSFLSKESNKITDVNIIVPKKVVEVTFADGTKQKSVCREPDTFSLETAISICISKQIMGGSSAYNNAVKRGMKVYENKLKRIEENRVELERMVKKRAKREEYKKRRAAKREAAEKEKAIAIQTEAYIRAMEEMENRKNGKVNSDING
jgi:hypothetical protein